MAEARSERERGTPDVTIHDPDDVIGGVTAGSGGSGKRATGSPNTIYHLSGVLFHALEGGASYDQYIQDAEEAGDQELADFFIQVRDEDSMRPDDAQWLIAVRTPGTTGMEDTATGVDAMEDLAAGVAATQGLEPDVSPGTELSSDLPDTDPRAEEAPSGDARREYAVTEMPDEDLTSLGEGGVPPGSTEEAASPRPKPSDDFPGTRPVEGEDPMAGRGEVPPPPEEIPPERAGEIPTAEEVPPPRTVELPEAEDVPSGTSPPGTQGASLDPPLSEEEMVRRQEERDRGEGDKGLTDDVRDAIFDEEGRGREGLNREDHR
jgi:hypothetical protein